MADLKDERGNPIYLTDQQGKPAQLMDEFGNAMYLTGVATTVPHLKESSYNGPHPITAPITTTNTPHHAQPIPVAHDPLQHHHHLHSYNDEGEGRKIEITDETKPKLGDIEPTIATATRSVHYEEESHEKKGLFKKIKEKLSGHHNDP